MITPPTVPRKKPGSTRVTMTRLTAAPELLDTRAAMARMAISPIQSPRLETNCAVHSRKKVLLPNSRQGAGGDRWRISVSRDERRTRRRRFLLGHRRLSLWVLRRIRAQSVAFLATFSACGAVLVAVAFFAVVFLAVAFAVAFLAVDFFVTDFFAVRLRGLLHRSLRGRRSRRPLSEAARHACSSVNDSGSIPRGTVALVVPSVT